MLKLKVSDVDVEEAPHDGGELSLKNTQAYRSQMKSFVKFCEEDYDLTKYVAKTLLSDHNLASYLIALYKEKGTKPYTLKNFISAFNDMCKKVSLPNVYSFSHKWPDSTQIIGVRLLIYFVDKFLKFFFCLLQKFKTTQKLNPHFPHHADQYSPETITAILGMHATNNKKFLELAYMAINVYSGMRACDLYGILSRYVTFEAQVETRILALSRFI